jgi:hypothetical protein
MKNRGGWCLTTLLIGYCTLLLNPAGAVTLQGGLNLQEAPLACELRLGDNTMSSAAARLNTTNATGKQAVRPFWNYRFNAQPGEQLHLRLGSVSGLDTAVAHQLGQSQANSISEPLTVLVNGQVLTTIHKNGTVGTYAIPATFLKPQGNVLHLQAGKRLQAGPLDYDDCLVEALWLSRF